MEDIFQNEFDIHLLEPFSILEKETKVKRRNVSNVGTPIKVQ